MIVYGDRNQWSCADAWFERVGDHVGRARTIARGQVLELRDALTRIAIDTGAIAQALLDRAFAAARQDECSALSDAAAAACRATGESLRSLANDERIAWSPLEHALSRLRELAPEEPLCLRDPEGFAFYALYPELYLDAAMRRSCTRPVQVIGIRSIGTTLAGVVAAGLESTLPLVTVRPVGEPFARELRVGPRLELQLLAERERRCYAIVDEGPGLSGSSFAAVARYLCERGVERSQLLFFPSHAGEPGPQAPAGERQRYLGTTRCHTSFEGYFDDGRIAAWFEREVGAEVGSVHDVGAGRWRALAYAREDYPVSYARDERRKFLLATARGEWLLKFAGLGGRAPALAARARCLSEHGYTPELIAVRHGFVLTRYVRDAEPLVRAALPRAQLLAALARYLAFVAQHFPADARLGAGPDALFTMLEYNARALLGPELTQGLQSWRRELPALRASWRPTATDNKLDVYEWLVTRDGRLLKCDAHDHHAAHDCIGSQDPAWDVAGAAIELGLAAAEIDELCKALRDRAGLHVSASKLRFCELAYLAFRAGRASFGEASLRGWADMDAELVRRERERYVRELERRLR